MKKKVLLSCFIIFTSTLMLFSCKNVRAQNVWDGSVDTSWYNDTIKEFTITTASQLAGLAKMVNEGNSFMYKTIKLGTDIVLNDTRGWENWKTSAPKNVWTPIGNSNSTKFEATFDGLNHKISGLYVETDRFAGLFGNNLGQIINIGVTESYIKGRGIKIGGIAGINSGVIKNCYYQGCLEGGIDGIGGIAGINSGRSYNANVANCYFSGIVTGKSSVGGIVGLSSGYALISDCYNEGIISGKNAVGGIVGTNDLKSKVISCYNLGKINADEIFGGIAGKNTEVDEVKGIIKNCYFAEETAPIGIGDGQGEAIATKAEDFENGTVQSLIRKNDTE